MAVELLDTVGLKCPQPVLKIAVKAPDMPLAEWQQRLPSLLEELYQTVAALGGTISGEHGIGSKRSEHLPLVIDPVAIELQRRIKQAFDPLNILNPGKVLPPVS